MDASSLLTQANLPQSYTYDIMCIHMWPDQHYDLCTELLSITIPQLWYPSPTFYMYQFLPFSRISTMRTLRISENFVNTTACTSSNPLNQIENIPTGTVLPSVSASLVEKIESGALIEMGDLIPAYLGLDDTVHSKLRCSVTNISEWLQAFTLYVTVIAKK